MSDKTIQEVAGAVIAIMSVLGAFLLVFYEAVNGKPLTVPDFIGLLIGAVVGSYLTRVSSQNGARQAGTAAAQTAIAAANATKPTNGNATGS